jgi:hypothetical protein
MSGSSPERSTGMIDEGGPCQSCGSNRKMALPGEICLHFPGGLESLNKPLVWAYPQAVVCLDCGAAEFTVADDQLKLITENV